MYWFSWLLTLCNMSLYEGTKTFHCKTNKQKNPGDAIFLNILNLPPTQNSCLCCTHWRIYIPLLLKKGKKKVFMAIMFVFTPLLSSLFFLIFNVLLWSSDLFFTCMVRFIFTEIPCYSWRRQLHPLLTSGTWVWILTPCKLTMDKARCLPRIFASERLHIFLTSAMGETYNKGRWILQ